MLKNLKDKEVFVRDTLKEREADIREQQERVEFLQKKLDAAKRDLAKKRKSQEARWESFHAAARLDNVIWKHFHPEDDKEHEINVDVVFAWLEADFVSVLIDKDIDTDEAEAWIEGKFDEEYELFRKKFPKETREDFMKRIANHHWQDITAEIDIRRDWSSAFRRVKDGSDLSGPVRYSFYQSDLYEFVRLHKANRFRKKIEELLTDCNFHGESGMLSEGMYDECLKLIAGIGEEEAI